MQRLLTLFFLSLITLFVVYLPAALALSPGPIGTMTATNCPCTWTITSVTPSGHASFYTINSSTGQISLTSAGATALAGLTGSDTINVQASNGGGNGSGVATINFAPAGTVMPAANNVSANWVNAGLVKIGGIPVRNTQCGATVNPSGVIPPSGGPSQDKTNIQTAINNCPAGQVVQLGAGTFLFDKVESITINKGITLRGTGTCNGVSLGANPTQTGGPYCATVLIQYNGPWVSSSATGYDQINSFSPCGNTTGTLPNGTPPSSIVSCAQFGNPFIDIDPQPGFNLAWAGCSLGFPGGNPTTQPCGATLAADVAQGATTVQVSSQANFATCPTGVNCPAGSWVMIDEFANLTTCTNPVTGSGDATLPCSAETLSNSPSPASMRLMVPDQNCNYSLCTTRLNQEVHVIQSMGPGPCPGVNCTLTFDSPLVLAFRQSGGHDARVYWPTIAGSTTPLSFVQQAGVENLSVNRTLGLPLNMTMCAYCWVKNVDLSYWVGGASAVYSARIQWTGSVFRDCVDCNNDGAEYPFAIDRGTTEALVDNNITLFGGKGMVGRAATAAVVAYNYTDWQRYTHNSINDGFQDMSVNGTHMGGTHSFLLEGNYGPNCDGDNTHGNAFYHVFFRNQCAGPRSNFVDATNCNQLVSDISNQQWNGCNVALNTGVFRTAGPMSFNYWYAFVGNVLGLAGFTTPANGWVYFRCQAGCGNHSQNNSTIWASGWTGGDPFLDNGFPDLNLNGVNGTFIFRNSNFDYVTNGIPSTENPPPGFSGALPNSMYLSSAPPYFGTGSTGCTYTWPWVQSASSPPIKANGCGGSGLPAQARWQAGTPFVQP